MMMTMLDIATGVAPEVVIHDDLVWGQDFLHCQMRVEMCFSQPCSSFADSKQQSVHFRDGNLA